MTIRWGQAGPFVVGQPEAGAFVRPDHEPQAVAISVRHPGPPVQLHTPWGLRTVWACSREDWAAFVEAVKAGAFDVVLPRPDGNPGP